MLYELGQIRDLALQSSTSIDCLTGQCDCYAIPPMGDVIIELIPAQVPFTLPISLPLRFESSVNCDVTGDGQVNVGDALQVLREAIGLRPNGCFQ